MKFVLNFVNVENQIIIEYSAIVGNLFIIGYSSG